MGRSKHSSRQNYTHERGNVRRLELLNAAIELLGQQDIDELSFVDVARQANVPTASAYHFYRNKNDLLGALVGYYHEEINDFVLRPYKLLPNQNWMDVIDQVIERALDYFRKNEIPRKLFYSGKAPPEIKQLDRTGDKQIGTNIETILDTYFELPEIPDKQLVFFILVELIDTVFTLSVIEHGEISVQMAEETKRVTKAYLRSYLPELLVRKTN